MKYLILLLMLCLVATGCTTKEDQEPTITPTDYLLEINNECLTKYSYTVLWDCQGVPVQSGSEKYEVTKFLGMNCTVIGVE